MNKLTVHRINIQPYVPEESKGIEFCNVIANVIRFYILFRLLCT